MNNELLFLTHIIAIITISMLALKLGVETIMGLLCLFGVLSNLFVLKQITLCGLHITSSDVYAVGCIFCLNLIQEFFGKPTAFKGIVASFFCLSIFLLMSQTHLLYHHNIFDTTQPHYQALLSIMPRLTLASLASYGCVQYIDMHIFSFLHHLFHGTFFTIRATISLIISQIIDTILFSFLGLYGIVKSVGHIIMVSIAIKLIIITISAPLMGITKKWINPKI